MEDSELAQAEEGTELAGGVGVVKEGPAKSLSELSTLRSRVVQL